MPSTTYRLQIYANSSFSGGGITLLNTTTKELGIMVRGKFRGGEGETERDRGM
jgi:hypothetical protein